MSFSSDVKEELAQRIAKSRHCQIAELAAIIGMCGQIDGNASAGYSIHMQTENVQLARKCFTLIKNIFNFSTQIDIRQGNSAKSSSYIISITDPDQAMNILQTIKAIDNDGCLRLPEGIIAPILIMNICCKRAFIRGVYMASGSMSDPEKFYHLEIVCDTISKANQLIEQIAAFDIEARIASRRGHFVVYIKEGTQIIDLLNVMEAYVALMHMENIRILKDMRNQVNRQVNCETANLNKTVNAAVKQIEDIKLLMSRGEFDSLPQHLKDIAMLRLEHPESSLKELGEMCDPPVGRSGVNHRLKKLSELASEY